MRILVSVLQSAFLVVSACGDDAAFVDASIDSSSSDAACDISVEVGATPIDPRCSYTLEIDGVVEVWVDGGTLTLGDETAAHFDPRVLDAPTPLVIDAETLHVRAHGPAPGEVTIARSLTWSDPVLLDDASFAGLHRVMGAVADGPGGPLLDAWFRRFSTTAHSERLGPIRLLEAIADAQGDDPTSWDLDAAPFVVTGVHNRIDLEEGTHCGELRVSIASTHPIHQPFHLIALFRQAPRAEDLRPDGSAHCVASALRWARLSELDEDAFRAQARVLLDEALSRERFVALETVDFLISPWEWRQWFLEGDVLENRPLFQTVDTAGLNAPSPRRTDFLAWVESNAEAIDARRILIPEAFRAPSARVNDGVPWIPLDLSGVDPSVLERFPDLRRNLEIVGCPACHATDAPFVQTLPDRSFSPFYEKELDARAIELVGRARGEGALPPFGPLQSEPVLPP